MLRDMYAQRDRSNQLRMDEQARIAWPFIRIYVAQ
jgi:hypothetical protein